MIFGNYKSNHQIRIQTEAVNLKTTKLAGKLTLIMFKTKYPEAKVSPDLSYCVEE